MRATNPGHSMGPFHRLGVVFVVDLRGIEPRSGWSPSWGFTCRRNHCQALAAGRLTRWPALAESVAIGAGRAQGTRRPISTRTP